MEECPWCAETYYLLVVENERNTGHYTILCQRLAAPLGSQT